MKHALLVSLVAGLLVPGCFLDHGTDRPTLPPPDVDVAIAAVSLGEDCPAMRVAGDCAPMEPGLIDDPCGSFCQQSSVTLAIDADGDAPMRFRVLSAVLLSADGEQLLELDPSNARLFGESGYEGWDEMIPTPSSGMNVLYDLNGVDWSGIEDAYRRTFKVRLVVEVDGARQTLTSEETTRTAPIVT